MHDVKGTEDEEYGEEEAKERYIISINKRHPALTHFFGGIQKVKPKIEKGIKKVEKKRHKNKIHSRCSKYKF